MQTALIVFGIINLVYSIISLNGISSVPVDETTKRGSYIIGTLLFLMNVAALLCAIFINPMS